MHNIKDLVEKIKRDYYTINLFVSKGKSRDKVVEGKRFSISLAMTVERNVKILCPPLDSLYPKLT